MGVQVLNPPKRGTLAYLDAFPNEVLTMSLEEYWEKERRNAYKSTFFQNKVTAIMPYTTRNHNRLVNALSRLLGNAVEEKGGEVFTENRPVWISAYSLNTYPDVFIIETFDAYVFRGEQVAETTPSVIIEVLSNSTDNYDKTTKLQYYKSIPSLKQIVFVAQYEAAVTIHEKDENGKWNIFEYMGLDNTIQIAEVDIPLKLLYKNVDFSLEKKK